jgi:hypothetical protein
MMFVRSQKNSAGKSKPSTKLHSIHALSRGRELTGSFEIAASSYNFTFAPSRAALVTNAFELIGPLTIVDPAGKKHTANDVRATLLSSQGGLGAAPPPRRSAQREAVPTPESRPLPEVEGTGLAAFSGVLYFRLSQLDGRALGINADLSSVQLNARLAPLSGVERELQGTYSSLVDALKSDKPNAQAARESISELNRLLSA